MLNVLGLADRSTCSSISGPVMPMSGWRGHVLNVEDDKQSMSHSFIFSLFSGVLLKGSSLGYGGGRMRGLQIYVFESIFTAPFFIADPTLLAVSSFFTVRLLL